MRVFEEKPKFSCRGVVSIRKTPTMPDIWAKGVINTAMKATQKDL